MTRRRKETPAVYDAPADYGPALSRIGARVVPTFRGAADVELLDRPDPDQPRRTVRGASRRDPLLRCVGKTEFAAAELFRDDAALADGAQGQDEVGTLGTKVQSATDWQAKAIGPLDAQTRMRRAWAALRGPANDNDAADVVRCVVLGYVTLETYETARRRRNGSASGVLTAALVRLVAHYQREGRL